MSEKSQVNKETVKKVEKNEASSKRKVSSNELPTLPRRHTDYSYQGKKEEAK